MRTKAVIAGDLLSVFNVDSPKTTAALQLGEIYVTLAIEVILAVLIGLTDFPGIAFIFDAVRCSDRFDLFST